MRFTKGSVQRLAAGALISLQAKLLVVEDIFTSAQAAPADDDDVNSLFVHHARITVDDDGKKAKKGTTSASMAPTMSSSIAPLPNNAIVPPFQKTTADIGILVPAVPSRRSTSQVGFPLLAKFCSNEITFIFSIDIANIAIKIIFIHALIFTNTYLLQYIQI